jgi:hypothetical protein
MTETEWLRGSDPPTLLKYVRSAASGRKLRLFAVACCRRVWHFLDKREQWTVAVAERYADGIATNLDLAGVHPPHRTVGALDPMDWAVIEGNGGASARLGLIWAVTDRNDWNAAIMAWASATLVAPPDTCRGEMLGQCRLLRDLFGNPFRPGNLGQLPPGRTAAHLAQAIYDDRAFDRLPILADALEDAGCSDADILAHCRGGGEHVRGCWVVDLLLGK